METMGYLTLLPPGAALNFTDRSHGASSRRFEAEELSSSLRDIIHFEDLLL